MRQLKNTVAPNNPLSPQVYDRSQDEQFKNKLRVYFTTIDQFVATIAGNSGGASIVAPYGAFYHTASQTAAVINTAYSVLLNTTEISNGVYTDTVDSSKIYVDMSGVYDLQFSLQLTKNTGTPKHVWVWIRINGVDVANSASKVAVQGTDAETVAAWNYLLELTGGDYVQVMWATDDLGCFILAEAATAFCPAIASAIVTLTVVSGPIE